MGFSFFFRDVNEMDLIIQYALPELINNTRINIWSAGCSEGQEPYTLAIKLRENMGYFAFKKVKIFASDIDNTSENFGNIIRNARYNGETIKRIPPEILSKYFTSSFVTSDCFKYFTSSFICLSIIFICDSKKDFVC